MACRPVALRKESVDRNMAKLICNRIVDVALRKESVDRNIKWQLVMILGRVALRKESVDRNAELSEVKHYGKVALRKESVDRNHDDYLKLAKFEGSLSARRAWIEIFFGTRAAQNL